MKYLQKDDIARFHVHPDSIKQVADFLTWRNEANKISTKTTRRILICADELMSNIVRCSEATTVCVKYDVIDDKIQLDFYDDGRPFDPFIQKEPDITLPAEQRLAGGLGIFMVKRLSEECRYEYLEDKNHTTLTFNCK